MRQNAFLPYLQGIKMRGSSREKQNIDVWSAKQKIQQPEKNSLRKKNCYKKSKLKINVKKYPF